MNELINQNKNSQEISEQYSIFELSEDLLSDVRTNINSKKAIRFPIAKLSTLGASVS